MLIVVGPFCGGWMKKTNGLGEELRQEDTGIGVLDKTGR